MATRAPPSETRRYVQDERYFAIEHTTAGMQEVRAHGWAKVEQCRSNCREPCREQLPMDVRREAFQATVLYLKRSAMFFTVPEGSYPYLHLSSMDSLGSCRREQLRCLRCSCSNIQPSICSRDLRPTSSIRCRTVDICRFFLQTCRPPIRNVL